MVDKIDVLQTAKDKFDKIQEAWSHIYDKAAEDLHFMSDEEDAQWDSADYNARKIDGRPALTIDQLGQFVNQVVNDVRMNTPTINVIPAADGDIETANVLKGLIRHIQYDSRADSAYDNAVEFAIKSSFGFIRIDHDYESNDSFDQKLLIKPVVNPHAVYIDSESVEPDGSDAKCAYVLDVLSREEFDNKYPGRSAVSFAEIEGIGGKEDDVVIAEYFYIDQKEIEIGLLEDGTTEKVQKGVDYVDTRKVNDDTVRRYKLSGEDILEETTFPGKYIPVIPVYGAISWNKGKRNLFSLIRKSKDGQRLYNYWRSLETELLMKQPNAPILAAAGTTEDFAADYRNPAKAAVLRYKTTDLQGNPAQPPQRLAPPTIPTGIVNASRETVEDIKATMGMYNASLGMRSNETSGVAIAQRKQEGDVATFHFGDNQVRSITQVGKVLVSAIPEIYDTPRILSIVGEEEEVKNIAVNGAQPVEGQKQEFDITKVGKYNIKVTTGASFTTQRQEAAEYFNQIIQGNPALMQVAGDLLFKNMDFPGAEAMSNRLKKTIPPELLQEDEEEIDPAVMQAQMQLQQAQEVMAQMQAQLESIQMELDNKEAEIAIKAQDNQIKAQSDQAKIESDRMKLEIDLMKLRLEEVKVQGELELKRRELDIKQSEMEIKGIDMIASNEIAAQQQSPLNYEGVYQGETND